MWKNAKGNRFPYLLKPTCVCWVHQLTFGNTFVYTTLITHYLWKIERLGDERLRISWEVGLPNKCRHTIVVTYGLSALGLFEEMLFRQRKRRVTHFIAKNYDISFALMKRIWRFPQSIKFFFPVFRQKMSSTWLELCFSPFLQHFSWMNFWQAFFCSKAHLCTMYMYMYSQLFGCSKILHMHLKFNFFCSPIDSKNVLLLIFKLCCWSLRTVFQYLSPLSSYRHFSPFWKWDFYLCLRSWQHTSYI